MFKGFKSLLAGLVAGTAFGILFAPKKGKETRESFKKEIDEGGIGLDTIKDTAKGMGKEVQDSYEEIPEEAKEKIRKGISKAKKTAKKLKKKVSR